MGKSDDGEAGQPSLPSYLERLKQCARSLKIQTYALYLAYCDPRTPWYAKAWAILVVAYALSPIDLIPDFIPVLGYLDDLILIPAGIALALKLIPAQVMEEARQKAQQQVEGSAGRMGRVGAVIVVLVWVVVVSILGVIVFRLVRGE